MLSLPSLFLRGRVMVARAICDLSLFSDERKLLRTAIVVPADQMLQLIASWASYWK